MLVNRVISGSGGAVVDEVGGGKLLFVFWNNLLCSRTGHECCNCVWFVIIGRKR